MWALLDGNGRLSWQFVSRFSSRLQRERRGAFNNSGDNNNAAGVRGCYSTHSADARAEKERMRSVRPCVTMTVGWSEPIQGQNKRPKQWSTLHAPVGCDEAGRRCLVLSSSSICTRRNAPLQPHTQRIGQTSGAPYASYAPSTVHTRLAICCTLCSFGLG